MKSTEERPRDNVTDAFDGANKRSVFVQRQVRSNAVVVGGIGLKDPAQVGLAQNHDVIQAFPADRADQPLRMAILPG